MSGRRSRRNRHAEPCVYCQKAPGTTRDHVPPSCLYPDPKPQLVKVPCCPTCRQLQPADDEYFKNMIAMRVDVAEHPVGGQLLESVHRALARPDHRGFTTALIKSTKVVDQVSAAGLYLGRGVSYSVDTRRLDRVMERVVLGLYYREERSRLPETHRAYVLSIEGLEGAPDEHRATVQRLIDAALVPPRRSVGDPRVFSYWAQKFEDDPHRTIWMLAVFERVFFLGFTERRALASEGVHHG